MEEQVEAVETPVEQTTETESAPVETNTEVAPQESADTIVEPEKEISKAVPYERFKEVNDQLKELREMVTQGYQPVQTPQYQGTPELDEESAQAVQNYVMQTVAQAEIQKFNVKHGAELAKDPVLKAQVEAHMREQAAKGQAIVPEIAYETAKELLDARFKPVVEEAKQQGVEEGRDIAKTKQQLGAVGETAGKQPEVDDSKLSAAEYAKLHNIPRAD